MIFKSADRKEKPQQQQQNIKSPYPVKMSFKCLKQNKANFKQEKKKISSFYLPKVKEY